MTTRQSFFENCNLNKTWNRIIDWEGLRIGTVHWHSDNEWKLVTDNSTFDDIKSLKKSERTNCIEFHTQAELWAYIRDNNLTTKGSK